jgi:hypothetical protein
MDQLLTVPLCADVVIHNQLLAGTVVFAVIVHVLPIVVLVTGKLDTCVAFAVPLLLFPLNNENVTLGVVP